MKLVFSMFLLMMIVSCGFRSDEGTKSADGALANPTRATIPTGAGELKEQDSDGDLMLDKEEKAIGRNPLIANIPNVRVRFLQNYKISVKYRALADGAAGDFVIDTKVHQDDPDFKYRVGEIFIRNESYKNAANVGKFATHSWGEVAEHDLSWVSYPEVDTRFYSDKVLRYKQYFNAEKYEITGITVVLENSVQLKANEGFKNIKNLTLNFYYYAYEKEAYELIKAQKIERHFNAGVNETFDVVLENVPATLIVENYFKRGEFIISELGDFEIPEMATTYKTLMTSVRTKSVPVIYNTPLESDVSYIGMNGNEKSFAEILNILFGSKIVIEQDKLKKINQFETNLADFTYLAELKAIDKQGKWFIFTNKLNQHYLDYKFSPKDIISLSYITGNVLAEQPSEKIFSFREAANSENGAKLYPLGNVLPNSIIHIQMEPKRVWGEIKRNWTDSISSPGGSCGQNCISREFTCWHEFNLFDSIDTTFVFSKDYDWELGRIKLLVNQDEFSLKELVDAKKIEAYWLGGKLHLVIREISKIKEIKEFEDTLLALKLITFQETTFSGIKLANWAGQDWRMCIVGTTNMAAAQGWPLSVDSREFGSWAGGVNWGNVKRGEPKSYTRDFSIGVSSVITNMFN